jgi:hypothetical protein
MVGLGVVQLEVTIEQGYQTVGKFLEARNDSLQQELAKD